VAYRGAYDEANESNFTAVYVMGKGKRKTCRLAQMSMLWQCRCTTVSQKNPP